ncbi:MAG: tRNA pseudouridine(13) synthase TruD, partial [archaeon]
WGMRKPIVLRVHEFKLGTISSDEFFEGKTRATVSFWLDKGTYATTVLRELLKNDGELLVKKETPVNEE